MSIYANSQVIIQQAHPPYNKFLPQLTRATISSVFPWQCPTLDLTLTVHGGEVQKHLSTVKAHDYIRVQVSHSSIKNAYTWREIFSGKIMNMISETSEGEDALRVIAQGHGVELLGTSIKHDYQYTNFTTGEILQDLVSDELTAIQESLYSYIDTEDSTTIVNYNIDKDTKYMVDVLQSLQKFELNNYVFDTVPIYDSHDILTGVYPVWKPIQTTATTKYRVVEATPRYLGSQFEYDSDKQVKSVTIYGDDSITPQRVGTVTGGGGEYDYVDTDLSLGSNSLCQRVADSIYNLYKDAAISGYANITMEPNAKPADLVYCYVPSKRLNNKEIDGNYRVSRVQHIIQAKEVPYTRLDFGNITLTPYEILSMVQNSNRLNNANFITGV